MIYSRRFSFLKNVCAKMIYVHSMPASSRLIRLCIFMWSFAAEPSITAFWIFQKRFSKALLWMDWLNWSELHTPAALRFMYLVAGSVCQPNWTADYRDLSHQLLTSCSQIAERHSASPSCLSPAFLHEWTQGRPMGSALIIRFQYLGI